MIKAEEYYEVKQDIDKRLLWSPTIHGGYKELKLASNKKLKHSCFTKLVDQKVNYFLEKPFTVSFMKQNGSTRDNENNNLLNDFFTQTVRNKISKLARKAIIYGISYCNLYYNQDKKIDFRIMKSYEIIPIWENEDHNILDGVIYIYEKEYQGKRLYFGEFYDRRSVYYFTYDGEKVEINGKTEHMFKSVPFIFLKYNDNESSLLSYCKGFIDESNEALANLGNTLADLPNAILAIKNYDGSDAEKTRHFINTNKMIFYNDDGGAQFLTTPINVEGFNAYYNALRKGIYEFGRGVDTQELNFGNSRSGEALKFIYADLDMDCNNLESNLIETLENLVGLCFFKEKGISPKFTFNRDIAVFETSAIENCVKSVDILSKETIVKNHPWTTNIGEELRIIKEEI